MCVPFLTQQSNAQRSKFDVDRAGWVRSPCHKPTDTTSHEGGEQCCKAQETAQTVQVFRQKLKMHREPLLPEFPRAEDPLVHHPCPPVCGLVFHTAAVPPSPQRALCAPWPCCSHCSGMPAFSTGSRKTPVNPSAGGAKLAYILLRLLVRFSFGGILFFFVNAHCPLAPTLLHFPVIAFVRKQRWCQ